jgi:DNA invertase Pin-like site-specific DNA recombinase
VNAAIYARISQDRIGAGLGIGRQREDCQRLITERGWNVAGIYEDNDISAYSGKLRPGYRQLLADLETGDIDAVVAWHTDRLHRSPRELEEWIDACERHGVATVTVRAGELDLATAAGRMVARMLGAAARHESEQKGERVRRAREQAARAGQPHGPLGYGYRRDPDTSQWEVDADEAAVISEIAQRVLAGDPLRAIATDLTRRGIPTPSHAPNGWRGPNLRQMITAARYCGWREWTPAGTRDGRGRGRGMGEFTAPGEGPAILTREQTETIRMLVSDPTRRSGGRRAAHLLTGILRCGRCGASLSISGGTAAGRWRYSCLAQPGLGSCGRLSITGPPTDAHATAAFFAALADTPLPTTEHSPSAAAPSDTVVGALQRDRQRLDELAADYADGRITRREWLTARDVIAARVDTSASALRDTARSHTLRRLNRPASQLAKAWTDLPIAQQRAALTAVIDRIVVHPAGRRARAFDPRRLEILWRV